MRSLALIRYDSYVDIISAEAVSVVPPTLRLTIQPVRSITRVIIDGRTADDWYQDSPTTLVVEIKGTLEAVKRMEVIGDPFHQVIGAFSFKVSRGAYIVGPDRLLQIIARLLSTRKGSIPDEPMIGCRLYKIAKGSFDRDKAETVLADISGELKDVEQQIIQVQSRQKNLKPKERLARMDVVKATVVEPSGSYLIALRITTYAGSILSHYMVWRAG